MTRLILADQHALALHGLRRYLEDRGMAVIGEVRTGEVLLQEVQRKNPDLLILDPLLPVLNGLRAVEQLRRWNPGLPILAMSRQRAPDVVIKAFAAGVSGYLIKECELEEVDFAIKSILGGHSYLTPLLVGPVMGLVGQVWDWAYAPVFKLNDSDQKLVQLLAEGRSCREIAHILDTKVRSIQSHKEAVMKRLRLRTPADVVKFALREHLIEA